MLLKYLVTTEDAGLTPALILKREFGISQQFNKKIRYEGSLTLSGKPARMIDPCKPGDLIIAEYDVPGEMPPGQRLQPVHDIHILYEDDDLVVVDKPAPLLTHPAYKGQENSLITLLGAEFTLHPVSRLDRQTSGLVLLAKNGYIHHRLTNTEILKVYCGFVYGCPEVEEGSFTWPIRRQADSIILRRATSPDDPAGQTARTDYKVLRTYTLNGKEAAVSKLSFRLWSGRTHQIRVHCRAAQCPLIGDGLYGFGDRLNEKTPAPEWAAGSTPAANSLPRAAVTGSCQQATGELVLPGWGETAPSVFDSSIILLCEKWLNRQALHAAQLAFLHPMTGEYIKITSPLRSDLKKLEGHLEQGY